MRNKINDPQTLLEKLKRKKKNGKRIVFTNGCFDLIHIGHTRYLTQAKELGDILVVAINSDQSVKSIKGNKRPIIPQFERAEVLAALEAVDYVAIFDELDPHKIISCLKPDILVKGGDWKKESVIGREIVESNGGEVIIIPFIDGVSTSKIVEKIQGMR